MKQHVLLVVQNNSFPADNRVLKEARSLSAAGYKVSVISPASELDPAPKSELGAIRVWRYRNFESQGGVAAFFLEYANALAWIFSLSLGIFFRNRFHVLHVANPPDLFWPMGLFYRMLGVKLVYDQHDIAPEMLRANQGRAGILYKLLLFNEKMSVRCAHAIITINASLKERLAAKHGPIRKPLKLVYNCPRSDFASKPNEALREQFAGKHVILYIGLMAPLDGVENVVRLGKELVGRGYDNFVCILLGDGPERPRLENMATELGLQGKVFFQGRVPYEQVMEYMDVAEVCLAPDEKNEFSDYFTLVKVLEYMKAGKPFVGFRLKETMDLAGEAGLYADSFQEYADQVVRLLEDEDLRGQIGAKGKEIVECGLLWEHQEETLLNLYRAIL